MVPTEPDLRYQDGTIIRNESLIAHDTGIPKDIRTMLPYQRIVNDIHQSTQVEIDASLFLI